MSLPDCLPTCLPPNLPASLPACSLPAPCLPSCIADKEEKSLYLASKNTKLNLAENLMKNICKNYTWRKNK